MIVTTRDEVLREIRDHRNRGWIISPHDDIQNNLLGYYVVNPNEISKIFQWNMFDEIIDDLTVDSILEMVQFVSDGPLYNCNNQKMLLIGVAKYVMESGKLIIRRLRLSTLRYAQHRGLQCEERRLYDKLMKQNIATEQDAINRMKIDLGELIHGPYRQNG